MNLNLQDWKDFRLDKLFDIKKGKRLTAADQEDGNNNYIGAIDSNNGIANHISQHPIHKANTISLSYNGSVGEAFYQKDPYWATDDVNALYSYYDGFNEKIGLFFVTIIRQEKYKFSYGRKWTLENMKATQIKLPVQHNDDGTILIDLSNKYSEQGYVPDWAYMENYIKSLHCKPLKTTNRSLSLKTLNINTWKEFYIKDLFELKITKKKQQLPKGKCSNASDLVDGTDVNYVGATREGNGVLNTCEYDAELVSQGNCVIMIGQGEGSAGYAIYMNKDFIGASSLNLGYADWVNPYTGNFVAAVLCKEYPKYSFGRSWSGDRLLNTQIKLPVVLDDKGEPIIDPSSKYSSDGYIPDWQFMEDYVKSLPYGDRLLSQDKDCN